MTIRLRLYGVLVTVLTATAITAVFHGRSWIPPVEGIVIVMGLAGVLAEWARLPRSINVFAPAVAGLFYVVAVFAGRQATYHFLPNSAAFAELSRLFQHGFSDIDKLAPPAPTHRGLVLITTVGVGMAAWLVDGFITVGLPAFSGLPLIALFVVPVTLASHGVNWLAFALGAIGYLLLLRQDARQRTNRWASLTSGGVTRATTARRVGGSAIVLALIVPLFIPLSSGRLFGPSGEGNGPSSRTTFDPIVQLKKQLVQNPPAPLIRYSTTAGLPPYLEMTTLDQFNGSEWFESSLHATSKQRVSHGLPAPQLGAAADSAVPYSENINIEDRLDVSWLPLPLITTSVRVKGDWRYDAATRTVFSARESTRGVSYKVDAVDPNPSPSQLRAIGSTPDPIAVRYTDYPPGLPDIVVKTAELVTARAQTNYDKAAALQAYFNSSQFHYSLNVRPGNSTNAIQDFLQTKTGYCEQYAATMALMARLLGIPSRVAIGFTHGTQQPDGSWVVTTADAHAWPELYFNSLGWVRFEPTPRADGQATAPSYTVSTTVKPTPTPIRPTASRAPGPQTHQTVEPTPAASTRGAAGSSATDAVRWLIVALVVIAIVGAFASPRLVRDAVRRRRWRQAVGDAAAAHAAWWQVFDDAEDAGFPGAWGLSPRLAATRLSRWAHLGDAEQRALRRLVQAEEHARYAPTPLDSSEVRRDVATVTEALLAKGGWRVRWLPLAGFRAVRDDVRARWFELVTRMPRPRWSLPRLGG